MADVFSSGPVPLVGTALVLEMKKSEKLFVSITCLHDWRFADKQVDFFDAGWPMRDDMKNLVKAHDICVLGTASDGKPHCSLMAYVADGDCGVIYMVTHRNTRKYANLQANPHVSLLIDSRETSARTATRAMTIEGVFEPVSDPVMKQDILDRMVSAHPHMTDFVSDPGAEVIAIRLKAVLLLDGLTQSHFERVE